jgi:hypothetical protein
MTILFDVIIAWAAVIGILSIAWLMLPKWR